MKARVYLEKDKDLIDIRYDQVFKAVFTRETRESRTALARFVSALIGRNVGIVTIHANELAGGNARDRLLRLDINCRTENDERINVEMCFNPTPYDSARLEYHAAKLYVSQDIKGVETDFDDLRWTYQISILAKKRVFPDESFYHVFEYYDPANMVSLNGRTRVITLELEKAETVAEKPIEEMDVRELWAYFLEYLTDKNKRDKLNAIIEKEEGIASVL